MIKLHFNITNHTAVFRKFWSNIKIHLRNKFNLFLFLGYSLEVLSFTQKYMYTLSNTLFQM